MKTFATLALIGYSTALRLKEDGPGPQGPPPAGPPAGDHDDDITPEQFIEACKFLKDNADADPEVAAAWAQDNLGYVPTEDEVKAFADECILAAAEAGLDDDDHEFDEEDFVEACEGLAALKDAGLADDEILAAAREASGEPDLTGDELAAFGDLCLMAAEAHGEPEADGAAQIKEDDDERGSSDVEDFFNDCEDLAELDDKWATWEEISAHF